MPDMQQPASSDALIARAFADGAIAAVVTLGLAFPVLSWRTQTDSQNALVLVSRWPLVGFVVAGVFMARVLCGLLFTRSARAAGMIGIGAAAWCAWSGASASGLSKIACIAGVLVSIGLTVAAFPIDRWLGRGDAPPVQARPDVGRANLQMKVAVAVAVAALFVFPPAAAHLLGPAGSLKWINNFGIQILIYAMLGWGLNIVVGLAGLLDLGYVAFYAVGAYCYALLSTTFGLSFWICLPLAGLFSACWGVALGLPVLRLRGDYLAIVTLAFGEIIRIVLLNWTDLTNGSAGVSSIPRVTFFGLPFTDSPTGFAARFGLEFSPIHRIVFLFYLILCLALATSWIAWSLRRMPIGRAWEAMREDEIACRSLGIDTVKTKMTAFALGAAFAGLAGAFFAVRQSFVSPESFTFIESATILAIVVLGGMGSQIGVALAAAVMIGGTELLRELDFLKHIFGQDFDPAQYRMLIFGASMVLMMIWRPRGLVSNRQPTLFLHEARPISASLVGQGRG